MILGISARRQGGKTTASNFILGNYLYGFNLVRSGFAIDRQGRLHIGDWLGSFDFKGIFDVTRDTRLMKQMLTDFVDPYISIEAFAEPLKGVAINVLGLSPEQVHGTNEEKNSPTRCQFEDGRFMTGRETMQWLGRAFRSVYPDVYIDRCLERVQKKQSLLTVINDVRYPNEVKRIQQAGGKVIRLTRTPFPDDSDDSETALDPANYDWSQFDYILDNSNLSVNKMNEKLLEVLQGWQLIPKKEE